MNAATRTKRVKALLRTLPVQIFACFSEQPEYTVVRIPRIATAEAPQGEKALAMDALRKAGWDVREGGGREFTVWA